MNGVIDDFGCINNTIKVAAGHYVDLADPKPETIDCYSIAMALSKICRYGGHSPKFYSVAEHCVMAMTIARDDENPDVILRAILLHDAAEAYIGDVVKPLKLLLPEYAAIEDRIEAAISERFDVDFKTYRDTVKHYDRTMLKAEKTQLWPNDASPWKGFAGLTDRPVPLGYWKPTAACFLFLSEARKLGLYHPLEPKLEEVTA